MSDVRVRMRSDRKGSGKGMESDAFPTSGSSAQGTGILAGLNDLNDTQMLDLMISMMRPNLEAFSNLPGIPGDPRKAFFEALWTRYQKVGKIEDLKEAINHGFVLAVRAQENTVERGFILDALATQFSVLYEHTAQYIYLHLAVQIGNAAIKEPFESDLELSGRLGGLGYSLSARYRLSHDPNDLDEAIVMERRVLEKIPHDDIVRRLGVISNLSARCVERYHLDHKEHNKLEAERLCRQIISTDTSDNQIKTAAMINLADLYMDEQDLASSVDGLDAAILPVMQLVDELEPNSPLRGYLLGRFGARLYTVYQQTNDTRHLNKAIAAYEQRCTLLLARSDQIETLTQLATLLWEAAERCKLHEIIEKAIDVHLALVDAPELDDESRIKMKRSLKALYDILMSQQVPSQDRHNHTAREISRRPVEKEKRRSVSMTLPSYSYFPLQTVRHIRLLRLLPGNTNDTIVCKLIQSSIDGKPKYEALSYVWGDQKEQETVICDDQRLKIGRALSEALYRLRRPDSDRLLWIDAVCIDQSSTQEKNTQLPLMRMIYQQAEKVLVWLGPGTGGCRTARSMITNLVHVHNAHRCIQDLYEEDKKQDSTGDWMQRIQQTIQQEVEERTSMKITRHGLILDLSEEERCGLPGVSSSKWTDLDTIYNAKWFHRVWTVQEMLVAKHVVVFFGEESCDWTPFYFAAKCMSSSLSPLAPVHWQHTRWLDSQSQDFHDNAHLDLLMLLNECHDRDATDPHDRVYALLGLLPNQGDIYQEDSLLRPDYGLPVKEVYRRLAVHFLTVQHDANILRAAGRTQKSNGLPTWVPDWTAKRPKLILSSTKTWYRAGGDLVGTKHHTITLHSSDPSILQIKVKLYDTIITVGRAMNSDDPRTQEVSHWREIDETVVFENYATKTKCWREWLDLAQIHSNTPYPVTNEHREAAYWRTLIADINPDGSGPVDESYSYNYKQWRNHMRRARENFFSTSVSEQQGNTPHDSKCEAFDNETQGIIHGLINDAYFKMFYQANIRAASYLRFAVTSKGHYALVPSEVKENDMICVVPGVKTPLLIRKVSKTAGSEAKSENTSETRYELIGACFVHGIMNGEVMEDEMNLKLTDILLV